MSIINSNSDGSNPDDEYHDEESGFYDATPIIDQMVKDLPAGKQSDETVLGYTVKGNRKLQITVKINACEGEWI